jgi:hypothetical protein
MKFYIYAGDRSQAKHLAREMNLEESCYRIVDRAEKLYGLRGGTVLLYGTWGLRNPDEITQVINRAKINGMSVLEVKDRGEGLAEAG